MQTYWITRASSGIGEALALELSSTGNQLILFARNATKLEELKLKVTYPDLVKILPFDLKNTDEASAMVRKA